MNITKAKAAGLAFLLLAVVLAGCPDVSNLALRGSKAAGKVPTGGPPVANQTLPSPTGVSSELSAGRIRVSWQGVAGAASYRVYYGDPDDPVMRYYVIVEAPRTYWDDIDVLDNGKTYSYQVQAVNAAGETGQLSRVSSQAYSPNPIVYTVTFNANGGSGSAPVSQTVTPGSSITLPGGSELSMSGFEFGGWNTNPYGEGTTYAAGETFTPTGSIFLYAKWVAANPFLGTWHSADGEEVWVFSSSSFSHYYHGTPSWSGSYTYSGYRATLTAHYPDGSGSEVFTAEIIGENTLRIWETSSWYADYTK
jgi:hypothetical protein